MVSAPGFVAPSPHDPGLILFILDEHLTGNARRALILLPSDPADEVATMMQNKDPDAPWRFEASGTIYDYNGRSFLLPAAIIALRNPPLPPLLSRKTPPQFEVAAVPTPRHAPALDAYLVADEVPSPVRDINDAPMPHERGLSAIAATDDEFANELERRLAAGVRSAAAPKPVDTEVDRTMIMPAASRFQDRRAMITRDPITGAWRAVLESSPLLGAPLAMELLPCRTLEQVDRSVRQSAVVSSWLVSGEVVVSGKRNYLLMNYAQPMPHNHWMAP